MAPTARKNGLRTAPPCRHVEEPWQEPEPAVVVLPLPGTPAAVCDTCPQPLASDLLLVRRAVSGLPPLTLLAPRDLDELARYRWLVGHRAAFAVWHLQTHALRSLADSSAPSPLAVEHTAFLYDVYCALLRHTGSCSARRYAATVRADMTACHPAFSGEWARDHAPVPELLRAVRARHPAPAVAPLTRAARRSHRVHMEVAERLVPGGRSLLQESGRCPGGTATPVELGLHDAFFGVVRHPVCERFFAAQLLRLVTRILCDPLPGGDPDAVRLLSRLAESLVPPHSGGPHGR
ncbi:hypothetical protein [Streptomyces sp. 4F14]|uniref:hypothetical protein n=1 Tax=Streptomyces sp. 4F14 TaxID=3394380 RepID=UPI003A895266